LSAAKLQVNAIQQPKPQEYHKINNNVNMTERMNECWIPNCYSCLAISWQWLWWATIFLLQQPCYFLALAVAGYRLTYNNSKWIVIASNLTKRINSQCEGAKA
jgi:hypothetical protein